MCVYTHAFQSVCAPIVTCALIRTSTVIMFVFNLDSDEETSGCRFGKSFFFVFFCTFGFVYVLIFLVKFK